MSQNQNLEQETIGIVGEQKIEPIHTSYAINLFEDAYQSVDQSSLKWEVFNKYVAYRYERTNFLEAKGFKAIYAKRALDATDKAIEEGLTRPDFLREFLHLNEVARGLERRKAEGINRHGSMMMVRDARELAESGVTEIMQVAKSKILEQNS